MTPGDTCGGVTLAADVGRLPPYAGLAPEALSRADRLLAAHPAISLHDHPVRLPEPLTAETWRAWRGQGREQLGYAGLARSGLAGIVASALSGGDLTTITRWAALLRADLAHQPGARLAERVADIPPGAAPPLAVFLGLEDLAAVDQDPSGVEVLYGIGIRCAGLAYSGGNALGGGLLSDPDEGLTPVGREVVTLMNDLGMVVDVAHVGDRTALDACAASRKPVVVSHAGARTVWPTARMKPDEVCEAVAGTGGVVALEAAPTSTVSPAHLRHTLESVMDHLTYLVDLVGVDHVAVGPDTFFGDHVGMYTALDSGPGWPAPPHDDIPYVDGMENPGEATRNVAAWLVAHEWADADIAKVVGGNVVRVMAATFEEEL